LTLFFWYVDDRSVEDSVIPETKVIRLVIFFFFEKVTTRKSSTVINVLYTGPEGTETELDLASHFRLGKI